MFVSNALIGLREGLEAALVVVSLESAKGAVRVARAKSGAERITGCGSVTDNGDAVAFGDATRWASGECDRKPGNYASFNGVSLTGSYSGGGSLTVDFTAGATAAAAGRLPAASAGAGCCARGARASRGPRTGRSPCRSP